MSVALFALILAPVFAEWATGKPVWLPFFDAGHKGLCGIKGDGDIECAGYIDNEAHNRFSFTSGTYDAVSVGVQTSCAIKTDKKVVCVGGAAGYNEILSSISDGGTIPTSNFEMIDVGNYHACGLNENKRVECWGDDAGASGTPPYWDTSGIPDTNYYWISTGMAASCALREDNDYVVCWGSGGAVSAVGDVATVAFSHVGVGGNHACGVRKDNGKIKCWGSSGGVDEGELVPPNVDETYFMVDAAHGSWGPTSCGITTSYVMKCWGNDGGSKVSGIPSPATDWDYVSMERDHLCGRKRDTKLIDCWGDQKGEVNTWAATQEVFTGMMDAPTSCPTGSPSSSPASATTISPSKTPLTPAPTVTPAPVTANSGSGDGVQRQEEGSVAATTTTASSAGEGTSTLLCLIFLASVLFMYTARN